MHADFWHDKWQRKEIGFHEGQPNELLVAHFDVLKLREGARVFLPLCGKTRDIAWLLAQGFRVVGVELSELAVAELFEELGVEAQVSKQAVFTLYQADNIDIYVGDVFALNNALLGKVDAIYDRAAMVALPEQTRPKYATHLIDVSGAAPQLLVAFEYDQSVMPGPPFAVPEAEVRGYYAGVYGLELLERKPVPGGLKGKVEADEMLWRLVPNKNI